MLIHLIRHGETALNAARVVQPADTPLSARGERQAALLAERLATAGIVHVLCSDLPRARMTAAPIARASGATVTYDALLQERNFGDLRGVPYRDLRDDIFSRDFVPPGGESWQVFEARVDEAWRDAVAVAASLQGGLAVVTHGLVCASIATRLLRLPAGSIAPARWGNTSLTICDRAAPHAVQLLNCVAHLDGDDDQAAPSGL